MGIQYPTAQQLLRKYGRRLARPFTGDKTTIRQAYNRTNDYNMRYALKRRMLKMDGY
jgi:hypothetical protein